MNLSEFDRWTADLSRRFPSVPAWVAKCFAAESDRIAFQRTWFGVVQDIPIADALEINRQMQSGDLPWVGEYDHDKEKLPQHVRRLARQLAFDRREGPQSEPLPELKPTSFPAGMILRRILELTDKGVPSEEAKQIVLAELPVGRPNYAPRYNCLTCLDAGLVTVASNDAIQAALADKFHECRHRIGTMRCACKSHIAQNPRRPLVVYDPALDFKIVDFLWRQPEVDRFHEWCEAKHNEYWESKRHHEFDQFNERTVAP